MATLMATKDISLPITALTMVCPATIGDKAVAFAMRLAPSVSNGIIGNLGDRDLINRAQLTLSNLNIQVSAGRYLVERYFTNNLKTT